ncbi:MAG: hypothetical protein AAF790_15355 [Planctomycetota bacterium]
MPLIPPEYRAALRFVAGWVAANLARFLAWAALVAALSGGVMGLLTYLLVREERAAVQIACGVLFAIGALVAGGVAGGLLAAVRSLAGWITDSGLGPMASRAVFAEKLGVTDKRPEGTTELAQSLHGATLGEAKRKLQDAFARVFESGSLDRWLPTQGRWLASRVLNTAGWAAARVVIGQLPGNPGDAAALDLLSLRTAVGEQIERQAIGYVALHLRRLAWGVLTFGGSVTLGLVYGIALGFD